jgi:hypothetical protein
MSPGGVSVKFIKQHLIRRMSEKRREPPTKVLALRMTGESI